jgi:UDP-N-acetylmuramate: L-alanyl-gamma-D-glutamyl-meso-diaminopimelate ligase
MGGIAALARALGHTVTGSDDNAWPPMSDQLAAQGIVLHTGYSPQHLQPRPDLVVIGNALTRGNPAVEYILEQDLPYTSGPQWLHDTVLADRWVLAVAGTHGKTTTTGMLAWVLERAGLDPGFLVGGVPENFDVSARLGAKPFFVIEADEYDTAFFDKRSKFVHYHPKTVILNNLEYDHADIFPDLAAIERQFHHLVRIVPSSGLLLRPAVEPALDRVLAMGHWTPLTTLGDGGEWEARVEHPDGSSFSVWHQGAMMGRVAWELIGSHNVSNALAAVAAAHHAGVDPALACQALGVFRNCKRRLEVRGEVKGVTVYDDFAHHPTAIALTLDALRKKVGTQRILAVLEPRSNTMRAGVHKNNLGLSLQEADHAWVLAPDEQWDATSIHDALDGRAHLCTSVEAIIDELAATATSGDHVLIMSNGAFGGIHAKLLEALGTV